MHHGEYNPSVTAKPCHLPLHKGGKAKVKVEAQRNASTLLFTKPSGAQILSRDRLSHPDGVQGYSEGGERRYMPKCADRDHHSQGTVGVSPADAVIISAEAVILRVGAS